MKQKRMNRVLAALLAAAMMFQMLPMLAFAAEDTSLKKGQAKIGETEYDSVLEAVKDAPADGSTTTITLGEGNYTLYGTKVTAGKNLTFVGQGTDKTVWYIGADVPDPNKTGEYNGDYSFDGAGTVTFENMTLRSGPTKDPNTKLGFIRPDNTVVEKCEIVGWTAFWGYNSAEFKDTTFKPIEGKDAIWVYSSKEATFNNCTFTAGRGVKVYTEENKSVTVNFDNCTVENSGSHPAIYIDEYVLERDGSKERYNINITGSNNVTAQTNTYTCSKLFGFRTANAHYGHYTNVKIDGELVWSEGKMLTHDYTDGEKDNAYTIDSFSEWENKGDHFERKVTKTCNYCKRQFPNVTEKGYQLSYDLNDGTGAVDYESKIYPEGEKATVAAAPAREGFYFLGWKDENDKQYNADATITLTANTTLTAQWGDVPPVEPDTPAGGGKEVATVIVAAGAAVLGYYVGTGLLMDCYRLPYWPRNRSELALMLWEDADRPMPESTLLYPDVGQKEEDMDLQHAARWAMENELLPDLNWDDSRTEEEMKFYPNYAVSRVRALHAWRKAQQLKQDA